MTSPSIYSTEKILLVNDPVIDDEYPNHNGFFSPLLYEIITKINLMFFQKYISIVGF